MLAGRPPAGGPVVVGQSPPHNIWDSEIVKTPSINRLCRQHLSPRGQMLKSLVDHSKAQSYLGCHRSHDRPLPIERLWKVMSSQWERLVRLTTLSLIFPFSDFPSRWGTPCIFFVRDSLPRPSGTEDFPSRGYRPRRKRANFRFLLRPQTGTREYGEARGHKYTP